MADASKLRRNRLGAPPSLEEASQNLREPEIAPDPLPAPAPAPAPTPTPVSSTYARAYDGRSRRRTNRTMQLNLKVTPEFDALLRELADREELLLTEVLEKALQHYASR